VPVIRPFAAWLLILALAMLNGVFREAVLLPALGKPIALILSGLLLSLAILAVAVALARWLALDEPRRCFSVGLLWLCLTLVFEFGFGGMVQGRSWAEMLEAYTFKDGNLWPLVILATMFAPLVAARVRPPGRGEGR
jgi:hypothetical protein